MRSLNLAFVLAVALGGCGGRLKGDSSAAASGGSSSGTGGVGPEAAPTCASFDDAEEPAWLDVVFTNKTNSFVYVGRDEIGYHRLPLFDVFSNDAPIVQADGCVRTCAGVRDDEGYPPCFAEGDVPFVLAVAAGESASVRWNASELVAATLPLECLPEGEEPDAASCSIRKPIFGKSLTFVVRVGDHVECQGSTPSCECVKDEGGGCYIENALVSSNVRDVTTTVDFKNGDVEGISIELSD